MAPPPPVADIESVIDELWNNATNSILSIHPATENWKAQVLPLARIKKIMKSEEWIYTELMGGKDNHAKNPTANGDGSSNHNNGSSNNNARFMIAGEAPVLLGKACELLVKEISIRAWRHTERNRRRTLQRQDVHAAVGESEVYDFLIDIVPRVPTGSSSATTTNPATTTTTTATTTNHVKYDPPSTTTTTTSPPPPATTTTLDPNGLLTTATATTATANATTTIPTQQHPHHPLHPPTADNLLTIQDAEIRLAHLQQMQEQYSLIIQQQKQHQQQQQQQQQQQTNTTNVVDTSIPNLNPPSATTAAPVPAPSVMTTLPHTTIPATTANAPATTTATANMMIHHPTAMYMQHPSQWQTHQPPTAATTTAIPFTTTYQPVPAPANHLQQPPPQHMQQQQQQQQQ